LGQNGKRIIKNAASYFDLLATSIRLWGSEKRTLDYLNA
jgi:hypothetical protein